MLVTVGECCVASFVTPAVDGPVVPLLVMAVEEPGVPSLLVMAVGTLGVLSLVMLEGTCIASITAWTIVAMSLEVKGVSVGVEEVREELLVVDLLCLLDGWVDHSTGESTPEVSGSFLFLLRRKDISYEENHCNVPGDCHYCARVTMHAHYSI